MYADLIQYTPDDGHRTTAQRMAEQAARGAQERRMPDEHKVAAYHVNGTSVSFTNGLGVTLKFGPSPISKGCIWTPHAPYSK